MSDTSSNELFAGILENARKEARQILEQAEKDGESLRKTFLEKAQKVKEAEQEACEKQLSEIARKEEAAIRNMERRRIMLRAGYLRSRAMELIMQRMADLIGTSDYDRILALWIAEAVIGLGQDKAVVACSHKERLTDEILDQAKKLVREKTGRDVELSIAPKPLSSQGVIVYSSDGKVAYNNQVATRLMRYMRLLDDMVEEELCSRT